MDAYIRTCLVESKHCFLTGIHQPLGAKTVSTSTTRFEVNHVSARLKPSLCDNVLISLTLEQVCD